MLIINIMFSILEVKLLLKVAYIAGVEGELFSLSMALKRIGGEYEGSVDIRVYTAQSLKGDDNISNFCQYALDADLALFHLSGGKDCCPGLDLIMDRLNGRVEVCIHEDLLDYQPAAQQLSTISPEVRGTISEYIQCGGD